MMLEAIEEDVERPPCPLGGVERIDGQRIAYEGPPGVFLDAATVDAVLALGE